MSKALIDAAASYYGMDPTQLANGTMTTSSDGLCFTFKVQVTDDDYLGIADRMRAMREPLLADQVKPLVRAFGCDPNEEFVPMPTLQEVMRDPVAYMDRPECNEVLARACKLSKDVLHKLEDAIAARGNARMHDSYPGPGAPNRLRPSTVSREPWPVDTQPEAIATGVLNDAGAGGREVQHVDAPAEEDSALPDAVWIDGDYLLPEQKILCSDIREDSKGMMPPFGGEFLVQVAMLTPDQLVKVQS